MDQKNMRQVYISSHIPKSENQVIPVMIKDGEKWYYLSCEKLVQIITWITSKHNDDHYRMICLHSIDSFRTYKANLNHMRMCVKIIITGL